MYQSIYLILWSGITYNTDTGLAVVIGNMPLSYFLLLPPIKRLELKENLPK